MAELKTKITSQDEFDALADEVRAYYQKSGGGEWLLQTDGLGSLRTSLDRERGNARRATDLLTRLVPELTDEDGKLLKYQEWESRVEPVEDQLRVLRDHAEDFDGPAGLREVLARGGGDGDNDAEAATLRKEVATAREELAKLRADRDKAARDAKKATDKATLLESKARSALVTDRLSQLLEQQGIKQPTHRQAAAALIRAKYDLDVENLDVEGVEPRPVVRLGKGDEEVVHSLDEWVSEWAKGEEGSELRTAFNVGPEGAGGTGTTGAGGKGTSGAGGGKGGDATPADRAKMSGPERLREARRQAAAG